MTWTFEGGECPRYLYRLPFGDLWVESHGPHCTAKARKGVWMVRCHVLGILRTTLKAKDGPGACSEAATLAAKKLEAVTHDLLAS